VLEPYYGGSHRHLIDGLVDHLDIDIDLRTLPPRKWKWRMRGAALVFSRRLAAEPPHWQELDGIFTSSLLDVAALRGLLPAAARDLPLVVYCHENQLRYPVQVADKRDYHYCWTNIQSLVAADVVLWNSAYNRDSFLEELPAFVERLPDHQPTGLVDVIAGRSTVVPVPMDAVGIEARTAEVVREGPCRLLWNHRWEHDKGPEELFVALATLDDAEIDFEVSILGQAFARQPPVFESARDRLGNRVATWGFVEGRPGYEAEMARCDFVLSTARHEFQGLAVLEAAAAGCVPLVPDGLAYPEIWADELRYPPGRLADVLPDRIRHLDSWRQRSFRDTARSFDWSRLGPKWQKVLVSAGASRGAC